MHNPKGIKFGLRHLREHKIKYSFPDTINPLCNCNQDIESATHFFLHCPFFINERHTLLSTIRSLNSKMLDCINYDLTQTLLFGNTSQTSCNNFEIINPSINYILSIKRFDEQLFQINSLISKSEVNQQLSFLHIYLLFLLVTLYFQVLSSTLVSDDRVILFACVFFVYILREVKCKFIIIHKKKEVLSKQRLHLKRYCNLEIELFFMDL